MGKMRCLISSIYKTITFLMLFHITMGSNDLIQDSCKTAAQSDPNLSYNFCVESIEANPKSHKASLEGLAAISLELCISNATNINSTISKLLEDKRFDKYAKECLQDCLDLYSDAIPTLQEATSAFQSKDFLTANVKISSAMDASTTCEDGFKDKKGQVSPLSKEDDMFFQLTAISLSFVNKLSSKKAR